MKQVFQIWIFLTHTTLLMIFTLAGILVTSLGSEVSAAQGDLYIWPKYSPTLNYNFRDEFPNLKEPIKNLKDCNEAGTISDGWWTFKWGPNKNPLVTEAAIKPLLARMNKDFAYFRDTMGWPPDKRAKEGYRSAIYLYGSGLCTDNKPNTEKGGWQSSIGAYPMVLLSYYPVYSFDPKCTYNDRISQMGACVHEGIHSVLADLPGCKKAAWFHEGGNTWLQQQAYAQQTNKYSNMGFLNGPAFLAPFMPIECYSGWLQDGSFGGPSAEGVNMFNGGKQTCTWRTFLGGHQYGNVFPTFLGEWLGLGSIPWIWRNCSGRVLEGISNKLGDEQTRRLISEYRAKQALIDMKKWSNACKAVLDARFGSNIGPEWEPSWIKCDIWKATPYAKTTNDGSGLLTPEARTTPGWSGANQVPLKISGKMVTVDFQPIGKNMTCQLCYRAVDGTPVYSSIVKNGVCSLRLDKAPNKNVVIAVVCNTDYIYVDDATRKAHFDYRLKLVEGATAAADIYTRWYDAKLLTTATAPPSVAPATSTTLSGLNIYSVQGSRMTISYDLPTATSVSLAVYTVAGSLVQEIAGGYRSEGTHTQDVLLGSKVRSGVYIMRMSAHSNTFLRAFRVVVK